MKIDWTSLGIDSVIVMICGAAIVSPVVFAETCFHKERECKEVAGGILCEDED